MTHKILVTGATGTIGQALIKQLQAKNADFVAGVRNIDQAGKKLPSVKNLVEFDFSDSSTYAGAIENVDHVFVLGPPMVMNLDELVAPFLDFLKSNGINRVVYLSALGSENMKTLTFHTTLTQKIKDDGFDFTILKPSFFAQNFKNYEGENIAERGVVYVPAGTGKVGFVDVNDIAAVAAVALTEDGHSGKTYEITGPETLSYHDAAKLLSDVTGKQVVYPNPTPEEFAAVLQQAGAPDFIAPYMIDVYSMIKNDHVNVLSNHVEEVTGKKPTALKSVLEQQFSY